MAGVLDLIAWIVGGLFAAGGLVFGARALLWDRPRGRRRCPKCWYDLTATQGLVCNECGHAAKREKKLNKTRRHLWQARFAVLLVLVGAGGLAWPSARKGPEKIVPTTVFVYLMPDLETWWPTGSSEFYKRMVDGRLWGWQWRWLINRCYTGRNEFFIVQIETPTRWPMGVELAGAVSCRASSGGTATLPLWPLRARIEPRFDRHAEPVQVPGTEFFRGSPAPVALWRSSEPLGQLSKRGAVDLEFDVIVERARDRTPAGFMWSSAHHAQHGWQVVHKKRISIPLIVTGTLGDYIESEDSASLTEWLRSRAGFMLDNRALHVISLRDEPVPEGLTLPVVIELLREGEVIQEWLAWWDPDEAGLWGGGEHVIPEGIQGDRRPLGTPDYKHFTWSVRVSGDPRLALLNDEADRFWSGVFEVPLGLVDTLDDLLYRSE